MKNNGLFHLLLSVLLISFFSINSYAANTDAASVIKAYTDWCDTIGKAKGEANQIVKFYAPHAILLPTLSDEILVNDKGGLDSYFTTLTSYKNIHCTTQKLLTEVDGEYFATTAGFYNFTYINEHGKEEIIPARFTFVYKKYNNQWLIIQHHSSVMPTPMFV